MKDKLIRPHGNSFRRKCRLYCVGAAKTGTHSIAYMFDEKVIRSTHEPDGSELIDWILRLSGGNSTAPEFQSYLLRRDDRLCLDVDSSQLNFFLLDYLREAFPSAHFLLTIRDVYSWLDSFINHSLRQSVSERRSKLRDLRFGPRKSGPPVERALLDKGLYSLDGYLSYWTRHNSIVLSTIPKDRLLTVRTDQISERAYEIAAFAGLPKASILKEKTHAFKSPVSFHVLRDIPAWYLETKVQEHCGALMAQHFPEIRSFRDSGL